MHRLDHQKKAGTSTSGIGPKERETEAVDQGQYELSDLGYDPIATWKRDAAARQHLAFPSTVVLSSDEGTELRLQIVEATGLKNEATNRDIQSSLYSAVRPLHSSPHLDEGGNIEQMLDEAGIDSARVLILLPLEGAYDSGAWIDRKDVIEFFDDLWYPSTDDLIVIDEQRTTLLMVDHHGNAGSMKLGQGQDGGFA